MVAKVLNIWQISKLLKSSIDVDYNKIQKSVYHDECEIRPWVKRLISYQQNGLDQFTNTKLAHRVICATQIMIAIFAAISISCSAAVSLTLFGLSGILHTIAVGGIIIMSTFSCLSLKSLYCFMSFCFSFISFRSLCSFRSLWSLRSFNSPSSAGGERKAEER